jgi:hypothetical protein
LTFFCAIILVAIFIWDSDVSAEDDAVEKMDAFYNSALLEVSKFIKDNSADKDVFEKGESAMYGEYEVYARAWKTPDIALILTSDEPDWKKYYIAGFRCSSGAMTFAGGIKVGSALNDVQKYFGQDLMDHETGFHVLFLDGTSIAFQVDDKKIATDIFYNAESIIPDEILEFLADQSDTADEAIGGSTRGNIFKLGYFSQNRIV